MDKTTLHHQLILNTRDSERSAGWDRPNQLKTLEKAELKLPRLWDRSVPPCLTVPVCPSYGLPPGFEICAVTPLIVYAHSLGEIS